MALEIFALLECYMVQVGRWLQHFRKTYWSHLQGSDHSEVDGIWLIYHFSAFYNTVSETVSTLQLQMTWGRMLIDHGQLMQELLSYQTRIQLPYRMAEKWQQYVIQCHIISSITIKRIHIWPSLQDLQYMTTNISILFHPKTVVHDFLSPHNLQNFHVHSTMCFLQCNMHL